MKKIISKLARFYRWLFRREIIGACSGYFILGPQENHIAMLEHAKANCDKLVVIINNDIQAARKYSHHFLPAHVRRTLLLACRYVDEVIIAVDDDASVCKTLELVKPDKFFNCAGEYNTTNCREAETCRRLGIEMVFAGEKISSSSDIIRKIRES